LPAACWLLLSSFIIYGAVIPFQFVASRAFVMAKLAAVPLNPFAAGRHESIPDLMQNVLLFAPFGFLGVDVLRKRRLSAVARVLLVTAMAALLSALAETLQLFTVDRLASVSDLVADTAGALIGALAADVFFFSRVVNGPPAWLPRMALSSAPAFYPLVVAAGVLGVAAWQPFDVSLDASGIFHKLAALRRDPWQTDVPSDQLLELLRYLLFTVIATSWLRQLGVRAPGTRAAAAGVCTALALEGSQIFVESRMPGLSDVSVHVAGVIAGAALLRSPAARVRSARVWCVLLALATWVGMAVQWLSPFTLATQHRPIAWGSISAGDPFLSLLPLSQIINAALMGFPVGFSIPLILKKRSIIMLSAVAAGLALALPLQYLQGWIIGRNPSVANIGAAILGCVSGAWVGGVGWGRFRSNTR